jgi:DNA modification methylase
MVKPKADAPAVSVEMWPLANLTPNPRNARVHSPEQVEQIVRSIGEFGFTNPILIDEDGTIVAGHGRSMAARKIYEAGGSIKLPNGKTLPAGDVPVIVAAGWSEDQRRAYTIADNQLALNATWDEALLRLELGDLQVDEFDLSLTGLDRKAIDKMLTFAPTDGLGDADAVPEVQEHAVSLPGDIWLLGKHRIICGSSTDKATVERLLDGEKPTLMVTDPPYGVNYDPAWRARAGVNTNTGKMGKVLNDDRADWREAWELFPGDVAYVWHASLFTCQVLDSLEAVGLVKRSMIIWAKDRFTLGRGDYHWQHEPCWYVVREGTQKPIECMKRPIENNSEPGDAVYEPFSGSGTTIIAAEMTGRRCFAIELNAAYVDVAIRRWQDFTGEAAVLDGGSTFAEVAIERASETALA